MTLAVLPGDGIGPEITSAALQVIEHVKRAFSLDVTIDVHEIGVAALQRTGTTLPPAVLDACRRADGVILGPVSTASYPPRDQGGVNASAALRIELDLFANVRPSRTREGLQHWGRTPMDLVIVRENTEGFYADRNMYSGSGELMPTPDLALSIRRISAAASARIARAAFELAAARRRHVTAVHKVNVLGVTEGLFLREVQSVARAHPDIAYDEQLVYLATWFPAEYRARMLAWFLVAIPASTVIGGPVSGLVLQMDGFAGLAGWQWLFIIEGLPATLLGIAALSVLPDRPEDAPFLSQEERRLLWARIDSERRERETRNLLVALKDPRVLILTVAQFGFTAGSYGVGIWLPQIMKDARLSNLTIGFVTGACYVVASVAMIVWAAWVDRSGRKIKNLALACLIAAAGLGLAIATANFWLSLFWITVALAGITSARAIFWTIPTRFLTGLAAAGGLAFINSIATLGGFVGPYAMGWLRDATGSFSAGLMAMAGLLVLATVMSWSLKLFVTQE